MKYLKVIQSDESTQHQGTYAIIRQLMESVPEGGFKLAEMRLRYKILDAIEPLEKEKTEFLSLEDDHAACIAQCLEVATFLSLAREALEFEDMVKDMMFGKTKPEDDSSPESP